MPDDVHPQRAIGALRIKLACLIDVGQRFGERAGIEIGYASLRVSILILWIEPDRLGEIGDGAVELTLVAPGAAAVVEIVGGVWIEPGRLGVVGDGAVEVA